VQNEKEPKTSIVREYRQRVSAFKPNARLFLSYVLISGLTMGVYRLLFNFYAVSLGFDLEILGKFISASSLSSLVFALPMGFVVDKIGRKKSLIVQSILIMGAIFVMAVWPSKTIFYLMNILIGLGSSVYSVALGPFLMENSDKAERPYLFSFSQGIQMAAMFAGNWVGGYLPLWIGNFRGVDETSSTAYGGAIMIVALVNIIGLIPLLRIEQKPKEHTDKRDFAPIKFIQENKKLVTKIFSPLLLTAIGAGMFVPFLNIYFRQVHNQSDGSIGALMAWGSLAMGLAFLIAPPISEKLGKLKMVVITQGLSIPFMLLLGFSPLFWVGALAYYVRMAMMNMSGPIYQNFVYEQIDEKSQATAASLYSIVWSFGWALSPSISGAWQVKYGFKLPFTVAIILYAIAISMYYFFWLRKKKVNTTA
jgi:MFS family permease